MENNNTNPLVRRKQLIEELAKVNEEAFLFVKNNGGEVVSEGVRYTIGRTTETKIIKDEILDPKVRAEAIAYGQTRVTFRNVDLSKKWLAEHGITPETNPEVFQTVVKEKLEQKALTIRDLLQA